MKLVVGMLLIIYSLQCFAESAELQDKKAMTMAVQRFLQEKVPLNEGEQLKIAVGKLDSRLQLPQCDQTLQLSFLREQINSGQKTVSVECPGTAPWKIYLPVSIKIIAKVLVASEDIGRAAQVASSQIGFVEKNRFALYNGYYKTPEQVVGMLAKRHIRAGTILTPDLLEPPIVINRGDTVIIAAIKGGIKVEVIGIAKESGRLNQRIQVYNKSSKRLVEGVVAAAGRVSVPL